MSKSIEKTGIKVRSGEVRLKGTTSRINSWQSSSDATMIDRSKVYPGSVSALFDSGDVSATVGTGGTAASTTIYSLPSGWLHLTPSAVYMEVGGTVATGETISISVKADLDDGSSRILSEKRIRIRR